MVPSDQTWSPSWRSLYLWKNHLTVPKSSQKIAWVSINWFYKCDMVNEGKSKYQKHGVFGARWIQVDFENNSFRKNSSRIESFFPKYGVSNKICFKPRPRFNPSDHSQKKRPATCFCATQTKSMRFFPETGATKCAVSLSLYKIIPRYAITEWCTQIKMFISRSSKHSSAIHFIEGMAPFPSSVFLKSLLSLFILWTPKQQVGQFLLPTQTKT